MKITRFVLVAFFIFFLVAYAQPTCPPCYRNQPLLNGRGPASATDPRRVLNIANDVPGANNTKVSQAINGGAGMWNDARDDTSNPPNSYTTSYFFKQSDYESADFKVVAIANPSAPTAQIDMSIHPHMIHIRSDVLNSLSADDLAAVIAHELGHRIGLSNAADELACSNTESIMRGHDGTGKPVVQRVTSADVFQSNRSADLSTTSNCTQTPPTTVNDPSPSPTPTPEPTPEPTPDCIDGDGDGFGVGPGCLVSDCADDNPDRYPGAPLSTRTWEDNNCNGKEDGLDAIGSPIVIDIEGDGFKLTSAPGGVVFDLNGDGTPEGLSWTAAGSDDAWLALDRDNDGVIDSGKELFGNFTDQPPSSEPNGFRALAEFDKPQQGGNGDDAVDGNDAIFYSLRLWQDVNHDGVSQPAELHALPELGLKSIDLNYKESKRTDEFGNKFRYRAKVRDAKGEKIARWAWDVFLVRGQ